jgi:hypothetical protein
MNKFDLVSEKKDLFNLYSVAVSEMFASKNVNVDFTDDDEMADYCMGLHQKGFPKYEFYEITQLLMYNSMLQQKASTMNRMDFLVDRDILVKIN